jgi:hypothetical protein
MSRKSADDIEVTPANKGGVIDNRISFDFLGFLTGYQNFVELAGGVAHHVKRERLREAGSDG